MNAVATFIF